MKLRILITSLLLASPAVLLAETAKIDATLAGHAILPAETLIVAPKDAPGALQVSGKFRTDSKRSVKAATDGSALPFKGQPLQGFSGIKTIGDGRYYVLTDNGFGSKANSPDAMLFFHIIKPDFDKGTVAIEKTTFLNDANKVIPFNITMEGSKTRYLTGADLDLEGFQIVGDNIVIGEEFGPFIIVADLKTGTVSEFHETVVDGEVVKSPDHYSLKLPNPDADKPAYNLKRSRGYEGFASSMDGKLLYPLLEGPLYDADKKAYETIDGKTALRILEMNANDRQWTGRSWFYPLEDANHAIGDFNMIDETRGMIIERDGGQGDAALACKDDKTEGCFKNPARFKRVYMIDFKGVEPGQAVQKVAYIDLMDIKDTNKVARLGQREDGRFTFPFVTIENVDRADDTHIIVGNDNNFPFSKGRDLVKRDNNEIILLEAEDFLNAKAK